MLFWYLMVLAGLVLELLAYPSSASPLTISAAVPAIPTRLKYGRLGQLTTLACHVNGTSSVTWCKMAPNNESCPAFPERPRDDVKTDGKDLFLTRPHSSDSGLYRCNSSDGGEQIALKIYQCDEDRRVEIKYRPRPRLAASLGASVSINCSAYFGCPGDFSESMLWQQLARWSWSSVSTSLASRLSVKSWPLDPDNMTSHATLTVSQVTEADYGVKFRCDLGKGTLNDSFTVEIVKPEKPPGDYWSTVVGVLVAAVLVLLVSGMLLYCFRSGVKYYCRQSGRPQRGPGEEYDALLLTSETTEQFTSQHLKPGLHSYRLQEVPPNRRVPTFISETLPQCTCVVMVRAVDEVDTQWRFFAHAVCHEKGVGKVVLVLVSAQDLGLASSQSPRSDSEESRTGDTDSSDCVFLPSGADVRGGGVHSGEGDGDRREEETTLAACPQLRWPGKESRGPLAWFRAKNFWWGLRNALPLPQPPPRDVRDVSSPRGGHDSTSSGTYLLRSSASRSDAVSPDSAEVC